MPKPMHSAVKEAHMISSVMFVSSSDRLLSAEVDTIVWKISKSVREEASLRRLSPSSRTDRISGPPPVDQGIVTLAYILVVTAGLVRAFLCTSSQKLTTAVLMSTKSRFMC